MRFSEERNQLRGNRTITTHDSALSALTLAIQSADSPLAANLAEILTDAIEELIEAKLTALVGALDHLHEMTSDPVQQHDQLSRWPGGHLLRQDIDDRSRVPRPRRRGRSPSSTAAFSTATRSTSSGPRTASRRPLGAARRFATMIATGTQ